MRIVGVSFGAPEKTIAWVESQQFQYEVWTDVDKTLATFLGAKGLLPYPNRYTYLLDGNAEVVLTYKEVSVSAHPEDVLSDATAIFGQR